MKFRKKPVVIEARQFTGFNAGLNTCPMYLASWMKEAVVSNKKGKLVIHTLEGDMTAENGDWIICGVKGEFYPVKDKIFRETYDAVQE